MRPSKFVAAMFITIVCDIVDLSSGLTCFVFIVLVKSTQHLLTEILNNMYGLGMVGVEINRTHLYL